MKVKIITHYHGVQSKDKHLWPGETHDLPKDAAENLIERGYAEPVGTKTTRATKVADTHKGADA
jgi:hypothetical protein